MPRHLARAALLLLPSLLASCVASRGGPGATAPVAFPFAIDSQRAVSVAPGVVHRFVYASAGPWAIHVLDVDLRGGSCYSAVAVKGFAGAIGRKRTSTMLAELDTGGRVVGGVNADFFTPTGIPTNAHVSGGRVITGPSNRPVIALDSAGRASIVTLQARLVPGARIDGAEPHFPGFNRPLANGTSWFTPAWGSRTDTASNAIEVVFAPDTGTMLRGVAVDTLTAGVPIPPGGGVMTYRGASRTGTLEFYRDVRSRQMPRWDAVLRPFHPAEAVGGRPQLVRDSVVLAGLDSAGGAAFASSRHPRTAVGIARGGQRLLLVTVDGRQKPYSDGMTLDELATLMLALGARDALNLDGGGSTTMVVKPAGRDSLVVANRPSDAAGERAVGNALAIVRGCPPRR